MGRDRRALTRDEIEEHVIAPLLHEATNAELMKLLMQLSPFWSVMAELKEIDHPVFRPLCREIRQRNIITNFPENYVALPRTHKGVNAEAVIDAIEKEGKVACRPIMASLGMNARHEREALEHVEVVKPEYSEARRILMLREGAQLLLEDLLTKEIFHRRDYTTFSINSDIATGVYVASETDVHIPTALYCGSAVLWNRDELVTKSYLEALAIHLHELTHVHGGDNQRIFTLEMSKWISIALRTMQSPELLLKICALEYMWDAEGRLSEEQRQQEQDDQDDD